MQTRSKKASSGVIDPAPAPAPAGPLNNKSVSLTDLNSLPTVDKDTGLLQIKFRGSPSTMFSSSWGSGDDQNVPAGVDFSEVHSLSLEFTDWFTDQSDGICTGAFEEELEGLSMLFASFSKACPNLKNLKLYLPARHEHKAPSLQKKKKLDALNADTLFWEVTSPVDYTLMQHLQLSVDLSSLSQLREVKLGLEYRGKLEYPAGHKGKFDPAAIRYDFQLAPVALVLPEGFPEDVEFRGMWSKPSLHTKTCQCYNCDMARQFGTGEHWVQALGFEATCRKTN